MEKSDDIIDSTLEVVSNSMSTFDTTLGKIPLYKAGHNLGGTLSRFIDSIVEMIPIEK